MLKKLTGMISTLFRMDCPPDCFSMTMHDALRITRHQGRALDPGAE